MQMHQRALKAITAFAIGSTCHAASNTVYRCEQGGKVIYTDEPCMNAKEVDVTPTEGMNKWSGKERVAPALQNRQATELRRKELGKALRPLTGQDDEKWQESLKHESRPAETRNECRRLDNLIPALKESAAGAARSGDKQNAETALYNARNRFKDLKC